MRYSGPAFVLCQRAPGAPSELHRLLGGDGQQGRQHHAPRPRGSLRGRQERQKLSVRAPSPADGPEVDWVGIADAQAEIALAVSFAGDTYNLRGDVRSVKLGSLGGQGQRDRVRVLGPHRQHGLTVADNTDPLKDPSSGAPSRSSSRGTQRPHKVFRIAGALRA